MLKAACSQSKCFLECSFSFVAATNGVLSILDENHQGLCDGLARALYDIPHKAELATWSSTFH